MLQSKRKFGVEIEFLARNEESFECLRDEINIVHDGSLRPHANAGEYVSEPLAGESGARELARACSILKSEGVDVQHPATSMHVHLDGMRDNNEVIASSKPFKEEGFQVAISRSIRRSISHSDIMRVIAMGSVPSIDNCQETVIDNITYLSRVKLTRKPAMNYRYFLLKRGNRHEWLQRMFYFYTQYSEVMSSLVSRSRTVNNMYCQRLADTFTLEEIEGIETQNDFVNVWYKGMGIGGHYDDSRYHDVNFHSFFDRHGTVEIRSHGATTDVNKILLWVRLHQLIADKLEDMTLDDIKIDTTDADSAFVEFIKFIEEDQVLVEYVKRLVGFYTGITIYKDKIKRK